MPHGDHILGAVSQAHGDRAGGDTCRNNNDAQQKLEKPDSDGAIDHAVKITDRCNTGSYPSVINVGVESVGEAGFWWKLSKRKYNGT